MSEKMGFARGRVCGSRRRLLSTAIAAGVAGTVTGGAIAAPYEVDWVGTTGDYNDPLNWGPFTAPHTTPYNRDAADQTVSHREHHVRMTLPGTLVIVGERPQAVWAGRHVGVTTEGSTG